VCSWWSNTIFAPLVWGALSIPIHFAGTFGLRLRMRRIHSDADKNEQIGVARWFQLLPKRLYDFSESEWMPAVSQEEIRTLAFEETKTYVAWSWLLSTATVIHILFGSLLFSGLLFIGARDALLVIFRYVASVLICRIIVMYELAGMREVYVREPDDEEYEMMKLDERITRVG
jgi:hypothetical protein